MRRAIICDIDGCIIDSYKTDDLDEFYYHIMDYCINEWCEDILKGLAKRYTIIFVTARTTRWRAITKYQLDQACDFPYKLYMRPLNDLRPDEELKHDITLHILEEYEIACAIDDKPENCEMYKALGIPTLKVL